MARNNKRGRLAPFPPTNIEAGPVTQVAPTEINIMPPATAAAIEANKPKRVPVRLLKHYHPSGEYEVLGWHRPEKRKKSAGGIEEIVQKAEFVRDKDDDETSATYGKVKPAPAEMPGTGTKDKIWASTVIRVSREEAKRMRLNGIGEIEVDDD